MFFRRKVEIDPKRFDEVMESHAKLYRELNQVKEDLASLQDKHVRLRGRVFAIHGSDKERESAEPKVVSREEMKRQLTQSGRFIPGRPAQHSGE